MSKIAVVYAYYEKNEEYRKNLEFFVKKGIYANDNNIDYFIVVNGETNYSFPQYSNLKVFFRENEGFDFAGYNAGIEESRRTGKHYDYYTFINTSCRGPFLPDYCNNMKWTEPFLRLFEKDQNIKMVGPTINMLTWSFRPHVQSYFFMLKNDALNYVKSVGLFDNKFSEMVDVINKQEVELSLLLLRRGWNISSIIPEWQNINYSQLLNQLNENGCYSSISVNNRDFHCQGRAGDILYKGKLCFGRDAHPYELIFIKTDIGRDLSTEEVKSLTKYYMS
jgi:lipopolysaccharide biosynthesis protein